MPSPSKSSFLISPQPTMPQAKMGRTLLVLLWKHFTVRRRQYISTPLELFLPFLFFILLFSAKGILISSDPPDDDPSRNEVMYSQPNSISRLTKPDIVLYSPQNNVTDQLMELVGKSMKLRHLDHFVGDRRGYFGINDNNATIQIIKGSYPFSIALVLFQNMDGDRLPDNLNYTIRMKTDFETQIYHSKDDFIGPHMTFGLIYAEFVQLQWTIDTSFLQLRTGLPVNQTGSIQEFPYVSSINFTYIEMLLNLLAIGLYCSMAIVFVFVMTRMVEERASGAQELIKMVGVTTKSLGLSHCINLLPGCLLFSAVGGILLVVGSPPLLEYSNGFLLALLLFLHYMSLATWAFVASYITINMHHATGFAIFIYVISLTPDHILESRKVPAGLMPLIGFLPGVPTNWFYQELHVLEQYGIGLTFKTMMTPHTTQTLSVAMVYLFLLLQIALFLMIAWYLSLVRPGKYGTALPWNFLFRKEFWTKNEVHPDLGTEEAYEREKITAEPKYFEPIPHGSEVGIEIDNVSKAFNKFHALNNVSLPVVKGEITVLLGHNGAGKTTLMSIVTGMMSATSGKVFVNGLDTVSQQTAVRAQLGFCPQHNLFFKDLTVLEHVKFFSLLKCTMSWKQSTKTSLDLLQQLGIEQKANSLSNHLSGGMKRRLQLACALAGDANVLVLDEPTAGLDVETRRSLWDLLLSLRTGRTVLISTHFMEEADALGDRVAALHRGVLRCYATPMHLKKEIDTGYRLTISLLPNTSQSIAANEISRVITSELPQAMQLSESGIRTLAFSLPSRESSKFPALFRKLEGQRESLGIESIGVGVSTLEEVFLKLCSDVSTVAPGDEVDATLQDDIVTSRLTGPKLILSQMAALLMRQIRYTRASWKMFLFTQILLPLLILFLVTKQLNDSEEQTSERNGPAAMNLDVYRDMDERNVLSSFGINPIQRSACCGLRYAHTGNITGTLIDIAKDDKIKYNKYLIGIELNETNAVAYFTTTVRHALPVAVNALTNAIASTLSTDRDITITTINYPVDDHSFHAVMNIKEPKSRMNTALWALCIAFLIQTALLQVLVLPCKERVCRTRHIHVMSGCSAELHWLTSLLYHAALSVLVLVLPTVVFALALDTDHTISHLDVAFPLFLTLLGGCLAFISLAFVCSFLMSDKTAATSLFAFTFIFSFIVPAMKTACEHKTDSCTYYGPVLNFTMYTVTPQTFVQAMMRLGNVAYLNAYCNLNKDLCPSLIVNEVGFDTQRCCVLNENPRPYFANDDYSPLLFIVALYVQFLVLMNVVFLTERGLVSRLRDRIMTLTYKAEPRPKEDILEKEQQYVEEALAHPRGDALLLSSVHKRYPAILKGVTAVRGVSFAVREGECFGLVGVNGAGKSTAFKMMTCETFPTRGEIVANDQRQRVFDNAKYLNGLGYCPQFFGMDEFLTGRQNLELLLALDGLVADDVKKEAVRWLELIDLMKYADRPVSEYSGGCSRRLSSVAALARRAALSLLDEPSAGVDVAARRRLWAAVRAAQAQTTRAGRKRAVLITSHSMDEMEALCSRVAIMSVGLLAALGSPAALRAAHNAGLALFIKIKHTSAARTQADADVTDSTDASMNPDLIRLKETCLQYQWTPKDVHKTMLNYHVHKSLKIEYSELFEKLEKLRRTFPDLIEDYAVTETTLEQVFLSYAASPPGGVV